MTRPAATRYRYRLKPANSGDYLDESYATRDTAVSECRRITKKECTTLFVVDSTQVPSLLLGACSDGLWRPATGKCKTCNGNGRNAHATWGGGECQDCIGFGVRIAPKPWTST